MVINAILAAVFGVGFVFWPGQVLAQYGQALEYLGQLVGAALIAFAVLTWSARNTPDSVARRAILLSMFIGDAIGFVVALIAQLGGVENELGWSTVAIYLLLAVGFGYFRFAKRADA
jgi:putative effector of murein hydrolase